MPCQASSFIISRTLLYLHRRYAPEKEDERKKPASQDGHSGPAYTVVYPAKPPCRVMLAICESRLSRAPLIALQCHIYSFRLSWPPSPRKESKRKSAFATVKKQNVFRWAEAWRRGGEFSVNSKPEQANASSWSWSISIQHQKLDGCAIRLTWWKMWLWWKVRNLSGSTWSQHNESKRLVRYTGHKQQRRIPGYNPVTNKECFGKHVDPVRWGCVLSVRPFNPAARGWQTQHTMRQDTQVTHHWSPSIKHCGGILLEWGNTLVPPAEWVKEIMLWQANQNVKCTCVLKDLSCDWALASALPFPPIVPPIVRLDRAFAARPEVASMCLLNTWEHGK